MQDTTNTDERDSSQGSISTGIDNLDQILGGGLTPNRVYLVEGRPGTGKTTMGLQFLLEGARSGEVGLYVTLSETKPELMSVAASHGWSLDAIHVHELVDAGNPLQSENEYRMFEPSEVELGTTIKSVLKKVAEVQPQRIVFDSLSEMRLLAQDPLRYRRQILALKQYFAGRNCTVLLLDDLAIHNEDQQLQSIAHGVLNLEQLISEYGAERRRVRVVKFRGRRYQGGGHEFEIERGGLRLFPRREAKALPRRSLSGRETLPSGNEAIDRLLGGGLSVGTSTLLLGPSGTGKSSCATLYALTAARRGERAVLFNFEESLDGLLKRSAGLGMDLRPHLDDGGIEIHQLQPGEITPGEFVHRVRWAVDPQNASRPTSVVIIDSLNGYLNAMPHERFLLIQIHDLLKYLGDAGINSFLMVAQHGMIGAMRDSVDTSYLADNVIVLRYFEASGRLRQAISVLKKRTGNHERTIREFQMTSDGIQVGAPLSSFHGVLTGTPTYTGNASDLLGQHDE